MTSLTLLGDTSGSVVLDAPAVSGSTTITFAAQSGTLNVGGPAFSAYANTTQSISAGTFTKVVFANERFDTNNNFASSTFTPTVAGYYQINTSVYYNSNPSGQAILFIYKNGVTYTEVGRNVAAGPGTLSGGVFAYANGSTDNFEVYFYSVGANTLSNSTDSFYVNFSGSMIRTA